MRKSREEERVEQRVRIGSRVYEQCWVVCGKPTCWCADRGAAARALHGPYWYMVVVSQGRRRRIYIGKELDTSRYIAADGSIDWKALSERKKKRNG